VDEQTNDLDLLLEKIFSDCLEAYCTDCGKILASGTQVYHEVVTNVAYNHGEIYSHDVLVRNWLDE
jgi:galactose-1-phosphate uridylyltransferase